MHRVVSAKDATDLISQAPRPNPASKPVVCVFCGSSPGTSPTHLAAARSLAESLHRSNMTLVYGGGTTGLMGEVARHMVSLAGPEAVHGIIPEPLVRYEQEGRPPAESEYGRTTVVPDMHARKHLMAREVIEGGPGGGFVALSGGYGTLEEVMEVTTWGQLNIHTRGICLLNIDGYYDHLIKWVHNAVDAGFISKGNLGIVQEAKTADEAIKLLQTYQPVGSRLNLQWGKQ